MPEGGRDLDGDDVVGDPRRLFDPGEDLAQKLGLEAWTPEIRETSVLATPDEVLYLGKEGTEEHIQWLRAAVATDTYIDGLRRRYFDEHGVTIDTIDGVDYITLYRGIPSGWEEATVAAGYCARNEGARQGLAIAHRVFNVDFERYRDGREDGEELCRTLAEYHIINSKNSLLVPASVSTEYARDFQNNEGKVLVLRVPMGYTIPISGFASEHNWGQNAFADEMEVAVVGRIEPDWIVGESIHWQKKG